MLLEDQDRARWDRDAIAEGTALVERALRDRRPGPYQLQAAIAALHAEAATAATRTGRRSRCSTRLARRSPSPVIELNRAVAIAMADGPERGLALIDAIDGLDAITSHHAARADLLRRLGRATRRPTLTAGRSSSRRAAPLAAYLRGRLDEASRSG